MGYQILLLDTSDPPDGSLGELLAQCGFTVRTAKDVDDAADWLDKSCPASVVIRIADKAAIDLCRSLRVQTSAPVLGICTTRDEDLIVRCLEAGVDRVLITPLSRLEVGARISAALGRQNGSPSGGAKSEACRVGDLVIDPDAHVVTRAGLPLSLTPTEFRLLVALARRAGSVVSHEELLSEVWDPSYREHPEHLRLYIGYLRQKLGDDRKQPCLLLNQRGVGYRLAEGARAVNGRGNAYGSCDAQFRSTHSRARSRVRAGRTLAASGG